MPFRKVKSKLLKARAMQKSRVLRSHLPETHRYAPHHLKRMLNRYPSVFVKPENGSQGVGIIRLKRLKRGVDISWDLRNIRVRDHSVSLALRDRMHPRRSYIIQQGIPLAKYRNRLIDIRVYMQKPDRKWLISGKIVRVGAAGRFITNYSQGGRPVTLEAILGSIYRNNGRRIAATKRKIDQVAFETARILDRVFPGIRILGIDMGLSEDGRVWIIEANTRPGFELFKHLKDRSMYQAIVHREQIIASRTKANGRKQTTPHQRRRRLSRPFYNLSRR